jgi:hypothetical protein
MTEIPIYPAADQDGYDGGYVATFLGVEIWAETKDELKRKIEEMKP